MADAPKKPAPPSPDESGGLEEVERALSVLGGRHPEAVRAQREAEQAKTRKEEERLRAAAAATRGGRVRIALGVAGVVVLALAVGVVLHLRSRAKAHDDAFRQKEAKFVTAGFVELEGLADQRTLSIDGAESTCYALVTAPEAGDVDYDVTRGPTPTRARGDAIFCTCTAETILASSPNADLRVLRVAANDVGGSLALSYAFADHRTIVAGSEACDVDQLAEWARGPHAPKGADTPLPTGAGLAERGLVPLPGLAAPYPFVIVPPAPDRCFVAVAGEGATLAIVGEAKDYPPPARAIASCDAKGVGAVVRRDGSGDVRVAAVTGRRAGGALGFRETLGEAGIDAAVWVRDDDRAAFAEESLRASLVPEPKSVAGGALLSTAAPDARVVLVTTKDGSMYVAEGPPEATFLCAPTMSAAWPESLCVQTKAHSWHLPRPDSVGAVAYGVLPFWMSAISSIGADRAGEALAPQLALLRLARRLSAQGFDPTIVEGINERPDGVDVLGRSGEDAVVVVGVWPSPPWFHGYSPDGSPFAVDGEARVIPLRGGEHVTLVAKPTPPVPVAQRRTVVFRHATK